MRDSQGKVSLGAVETRIPQTSDSDALLKQAPEFCIMNLPVSVCSIRGKDCVVRTKLVAVLLAITSWETGMNLSKTMASKTQVGAYDSI